MQALATRKLKVNEFVFHDTKRTKYTVQFVKGFMLKWEIMKENTF